MTIRIRPGLTTAALVALATVIMQLLFWAVLPSGEKANRNSDYFAVYEPVAQNILDGRGIVDATGQVATYYPPGFPVYIAANFVMADAIHMDRVAFMRISNLVLLALAAAFVYLVLQMVFSYRVALWASALWVTYPFHLWLSNQPNSEVPFLPLFVIAVGACLLGRNSSWAAIVAGLAIALAALIRPVVLFLPGVFAVFLLLDFEDSFKRRILSAALLSLTFAAVIFPWELHVHRKTGAIIPVSTGGVWSMHDGFTFGLKEGAAGDRIFVPAAALGTMQRFATEEQKLRTTGAIARFMWNETRQHPLAMVELVLFKSIRSWYGTQAKWHERLTAVLQFAYVGAALVGIVLLVRRKFTYPVGFLIAIVLYTWAMTVIVLPLLRYMVPAMWIVMALAAVAADRAWDRIVRRGGLPEQVYEEQAVRS